MLLSKSIGLGYRFKSTDGICLERHYVVWNVWLPFWQFPVKYCQTLENLTHWGLVIRLTSGSVVHHVSSFQPSLSFPRNCKNLPDYGKSIKPPTPPSLAKKFFGYAVKMFKRWDLWLKFPLALFLHWASQLHYLSGTSISACLFSLLSLNLCECFSKSCKFQKIMKIDCIRQSPKALFSVRMLNITRVIIIDFLLHVFCL